MDQVQIKSQIEQVHRNINYEYAALKKYREDLDKLINAQKRTMLLSKRFRENQETKIIRLSNIHDVKNGGQMLSQLFNSLQEDLFGKISESVIMSIRDADVRLVSLIMQTDDKIEETRARISKLESELYSLTQHLNA